MLAMDVVDTLRHRRALVERELKSADRDRALKKRLKEIYAEQGIDVPDEVLADLRAATGLALAFDPAKPWPRVSPLVARYTGPSQSVLYGAPIKAHSVGRYKHDLSAEETTAVEAACADLFDAFGYQL